MTINPAPLAILFGGGVDLRTDSKQVPTTKLLDLQNAVFTKLTTISKRNGYRALSTQIQDSGGDISGARGLGERDGEVLLFTDKRCYSYRPSADRWADAGEVAATTATTLPSARTGSYQTQPDSAVRNGTRVDAWEDSRGGVWCSVIEDATGRILRSQTQLDASISARNVSVVASGEVILVLWTREDITSIKLALINPATPASAPVISTPIADLNGAQPSFDVEAVPLVTNRPAIIAWVSTAANTVRVGYLGSSGTFIPPVASLSASVTGPVSVSYNQTDSVVAVGWTGGAGAASNVQIRIVDAATLVLQKTFSGVAVSGGAGYTRFTMGWGDTGPSGTLILWWAAEITAARSDLCAIDSGNVDYPPLVTSAATRLHGHGLVSRAFHDGADVYVAIAHTVRFFPYVAMLRLSSVNGVAAPNAVIVSRLMPGEASGSLMRTTGAGTRAWTLHLPGVSQEGGADTDITTRQHVLCVPYRIQLSSQNGDQFSEQGIKLARLNFLPTYQSVQLGRNLYLSSSMPMSYDGDAWHEADFHTAPDFGFDSTGTPVDMTTAITPTAGGSIPNGTYLYAWWYEAVDAQGEVHRGAPSVKLLVTMSGGPRSFSMALPTCRLTKFANVRICVARSPQGATGTDSTIAMYRVTSNDVTVITGSNRYVNNDPTVDTVSFVDGIDDVTLKAREPLYTNGGILPNAPSAWHGGIIAVGKSRLFWTDTTDPNIVRYSQQIAEDTALEAPPELSLRKDPFGGDITAIGVMDDTVVPFSTTAVYIFGGPGPLADPTVDPSANAFTPIELVSTDVGCITATSVGQTPDGLTFQSAKGIMMLTRARSIVNIGNDVQKFDSQKITHATLIPSAQRIVYLTDNGRTLMWDYNRNSWSTFTNHEGLDAIVVDNLYYYLRKDSRVFVETPGVYKDDNSNIPMVIETAWIHFAQYLQGWQRILYAYFLGRFISAHTLAIRYRLDYNEGYSPEILNNVNSNWNPSAYGAGLYGAGAYGGGGPTDAGMRYQRRIHLNKRCQAVSFQIYDIEATGDFGASFELSELLLIGGGIGPAFKVGATRSA